MKKLRIGLDVDQVLADFEGGYLKRFKKWPKHDWAISRNVENILKHEREFWINLKVINYPDFRPRLYCSARVNNRNWTREFLKRNGFPSSPLYQIPGYKLSKVDTVKGKVDVFIDDSIRNFIDLNLNGVPCLLMNSESNQEWGQIGRIYSLNYSEIEQTYNLFMETIFPNFKNLLNDRTNN